MMDPSLDNFLPSELTVVLEPLRDRGSITGAGWGGGCGKVEFVVLAGAF